MAVRILCQAAECLTFSPMYIRAALATSDVQSTLEIPTTDEIHMEDRNEPWSCLNLAEQWHIQHATQSTDRAI